MGTKVNKAELTANGVKITTAPAKGAGSEEVLEADVVLVSTGRRPYLDGLGVEVSDLVLVVSATLFSCDARSLIVCVLCVSDSLGWSRNSALRSRVRSSR
jgi:hypothetical protein